MDLETVFLISGLVAAWAGTAAAVLHLYGYIPPRYRTQLAKIQATTAAAIGTELRAVFSEQEAKMAAAMKEAQDAEQGILKSADMSALRSVGVDRQLQRKADKLIGSAILEVGQGVLAGLRIIAPGIAEQIEEAVETDPEGAMRLWELIQQRPSFQKYVAPRLHQYLGSQVVVPDSEPSGEGGWMGR